MLADYIRNNEDKTIKKERKKEKKRHKTKKRIERVPLFFCVGCAWHAGWKLNATQSNATYDGWCVFHFYLSLFSRKVAKGSRSVEERMNEYIMKPSPESEEHKIYC